jgi:hypothetical protein
VLLALLDSFVSELLDSLLEIFQDLGCSKTVVVLTNVLDGQDDVTHATLELGVYSSLSALCLK